MLNWMWTPLKGNSNQGYTNNEESCWETSKLEKKKT